MLLASLGLQPLASANSQPPTFQPQDYIGDGVFTGNIEGPATGPDGALYVVNLGQEGSIGRVTQYGSTAHAEVFVQLPAGSRGNGMRFDSAGNLYITDVTANRILRIPAGQRTATEYSHFGKDNNQPNDLAIAPDGTLYVSGPDWEKHDNGQLWRVDRDGRNHLLEDGMGTTNGVEVSPDGRRLYVNESLQRRVWVYDRDHNGNVRNKRLFISFPDHGLDGMRSDAKGNLYITRYDAGQIVVVAPDGTPLRTITLKGSKPSNVAFGGADGRQVFVTLQDRGAIETFFADIPGREYGQAHE